MEGVEIIKILLFFLSVFFLWKPAGPGWDTLWEDIQTGILENGDYRASSNLHPGYSGDQNIGGDPCATRMLLCASLVCQQLDLEVQSVSPQQKTHRRWSCLSQGCPSSCHCLVFARRISFLWSHSSLEAELVYLLWVSSYFMRTQYILLPGCQASFKYAHLACKDDSIQQIFSYSIRPFCPLPFSFSLIESFWTPLAVFSPSLALSLCDIQFSVKVLSTRNAIPQIHRLQAGESDPDLTPCKENFCPFIGCSSSKEPSYFHCHFCCIHHKVPGYEII